MTLTSPERQHLAALEVGTPAAHVAPAGRAVPSALHVSLQHVSVPRVGLRDAPRAVVQHPLVLARPQQVWGKQAG